VPLNHGEVLKLFRSFRENPVSGVINLHPAYSSLLVRFDPLLVGHQDLEAVIATRLALPDLSESSEYRTVSIPVCYHHDFAPDLARLASLHSLSEDAVIELHSSIIYTVYFLGFVPGFAYLGMLPEQLRTPRLPSPRKQVPSGSVGIADLQTGIYPSSTPGGWSLIGRTPVTLFDPARPAMSLLEPGDQVRFLPMSPDEYRAFPNG